MRSIFKEGKKYTFSDYFEMGNPTAEIAAALGYSFAIQAVDLPRCQNVEQEILERISSTYYALVQKISLNSETAKREVMIAPVLHTVIQRVNAALHIEYLVEVDEKLSDTIDYLFRSSYELIVIEAKKGDLERGFNQLAAEMIALDKYEEQAELENIWRNYDWRGVAVCRAGAEAKTADQRYSHLSLSRGFVRHIFFFDRDFASRA